MAGLALQIADVLGYKPSADERQEINLRELTQERGRTKDLRAQKILDDEIASVTGAKPAGGLADQVTAELMGTPSRQPVPRGTPPVAAQTPAPAAQTDPAATESATPWADAFRADPKGKGLPEAAAAVTTGVGSTILGGLRGAYELAKNLRAGASFDQAADVAAGAVRATQEAGTYQPKTASGKAAVEVVGSRANPLNWIPEAGKKVAEKGFEAGVLDPSDAAIIEGVSAAASPGIFKAPAAAAALKGAEMFKRGAKPAAGEVSPFGSAGSAAATNTATVRAAAEAASPELKAAISKVKPADVNTHALERQAEADSMGIKLTAGQATGDVAIISKEQNARARDLEYAHRFNEQNQQLKNKVNDIRDEAAPDVHGVNHVENGQSLIDAYKETDAALRADISAKYKVLEDANGGQFPIDGRAFVRAAEEGLAKKMKGRYVPPEIRADMDAIRETGKMTFEDFENMRTNLAAEARKAERTGDGNRAYASGLVRDALESLPLDGASTFTTMSGGAAALKPLADAARAAAKARFDLLKKDPAYKAAVNDSVAADDFINQFVVNGKVKNVKTMVEHLGEGSTAHQTMSAGVINYLKRQAGIVDESGNFSQAGYNKALQKIQPKLRDIMPPKIANDVETLGRVARYTQEQPRGSFVNNSNTLVAAMGEHAKNFAEGAANKLVGLGVVPVGSMVRNAAAKHSAAKETARHLKPGAGISLKDIKDMK